MAFKRSRVFDKMLNDLAEQRGTTVEEVLAAEKAQAFEGARRADEVGLSAEEVLDQDLKRMREAHYPQAQCLMPDELEEIVATKEPPKDFGAHLAVCNECRALLAAIQPDPIKLEEFLQAVREAHPQVDAASARRAALAGLHSAEE